MLSIIFFGTSPFAAKIFSDLLKNSFNILAIVTRPDKPRNRSGKPMPSSVKEKGLAIAPSLPIFQPEIASTLEFEKILAPLQADLFVVVAYGEIIKQHLLDLPKIGCINIHTSLLPKFRGAAPIQRAIMAGEKETGVTIIEMVSKMDAGDILGQKIVPILPNMNFDALEEELKSAASDLVVKILKQYEDQTITKIPQKHEDATFAKKITSIDCLINWSRTAKEIHDQIRALSSKPGAYALMEFKGVVKRLKVYQTKILDFEVQEPPGKILSYHQGNFVVACGKSALQLLEVQPEGKKRMTAELFVRGFSQPKFQKNL
ncbi:MAG: methionyl-tRNA formyltransferase [Simkaniaceae bacterium]|nr:methionyl-tRNA formyltransferase [Simkaniaceae bacterium]